ARGIDSRCRKKGSSQTLSQRQHRPIGSELPLLKGLGDQRTARRRKKSPRQPNEVTHDSRTRPGGRVHLFGGGLEAWHSWNHGGRGKGDLNRSRPPGGVILPRHLSQVLKVSSVLFEPQLRLRGDRKVPGVIQIFPLGVRLVARGQRTDDEK